MLPVQDSLFTEMFLRFSIVAILVIGLGITINMSLISKQEIKTITQGSKNQVFIEPPPKLPVLKQNILFAGDSMMQGVAPLTIKVLKNTHPGWQFDDQSRHSTGLTVNRYVNWVEKIKNDVEAKNFTAVVVFLGPNDPWDIYLTGKFIRFPSDDWQINYNNKVREICDFIKMKRVHLVWVGLPNFKGKRLHDGARIQNKIFHTEMDRYGFDYLSTELLLGSLDEPFASFIFDREGKKITVRSADGVHFTPKGLTILSDALTERLEHSLADKQKYEN